MNILPKSKHYKTTFTVIIGHLVFYKEQKRYLNVIIWSKLAISGEFFPKNFLNIIFRLKKVEINKNKTQIIINDYIG